VLGWHLMKIKKSKKISLSHYRIEPVYKKFGMRLKMFREACGVTQVELSGRMKMTRTSLVNIEAGRQRVLLHTVLVIAKALRFKPEIMIKDIWK
jgi:DNA-binding XRE family transcriptional regulator